MQISKKSPDANVYALMAIASRQIEQDEKRLEMVKRVMRSSSYEQAVETINEYIIDKIELV